jgi:hypothetical protein
MEEDEDEGVYIFQRRRRKRNYGGRERDHRGDRDGSHTYDNYGDNREYVGGHTNSSWQRERQSGAQRAAHRVVCGQGTELDRRVVAALSAGNSEELDRAIAANCRSRHSVPGNG